MQCNPISICDNHKFAQQRWWNIEPAYAELSWKDSDVVPSAFVQFCYMATKLS